MQHTLHRLVVSLPPPRQLTESLGAGSRGDAGVLDGDSLKESASSGLDETVGKMAFALMMLLEHSVAWIVWDFPGERRRTR